MNNVALVTGGSRGIGKAIALQLASDGFHVIVNYHANKEAANNTLIEIKKAGGKGELVQFDISSADSVKSAFNNWREQNPEEHISVLVNNAGIRKDNLFVWLEQSDWDKVIDTNLNSFYFVTKEVVQDMVLNKFGRIINIVSLSGLKGLPGQVNYSAAKAGVIAATKALAQEVGKKNVTVNAVAPGFINTDMTKDLDVQTLKKTVPLNRFGNPEEVAYLVSFLASEKAGYITGECISINGGLYS
ncbi:MAG: 3-oxoacyl-ACP reductase FabG [Bacteroidales bacterium]|nr:3-oxoacyl-ACP reductase FabG [Bacteroidales bacterium]